jgi:hypothetical protein
MAENQRHNEHVPVHLSSPQILATDDECTEWAEGYNRVQEPRHAEELVCISEHGKPARPNCHGF